MFAFFSHKWCVSRFVSYFFRKKMFLDQFASHDFVITWYGHIFGEFLRIVKCKIQQYSLNRNAIARSKKLTLAN